MSLTLNPSSQIVEQTADIEFILTTSFVDLYKATFLKGALITNNMEYPQINIPVRLSIKDAVNQGLNIAAESFEENTPMKKVMQNTYGGFFIDTYDIAPPILNINLAVEMPQGALKEIDVNYDVTGAGPGLTSQILSTLLENTGAIFGIPALSILTSGILSSLPNNAAQSLAVTEIANSLGVSFKSSQIPLFYSVLGFLELVQLISNSRTSRQSELYFMDFGRRRFHKISLISISTSSTSDKLNVLFINIRAVITRRNNAIPSNLGKNANFISNVLGIEQKELNVPIVLETATSTVSKFFS